MMIQSAIRSGYLCLGLAAFNQTAAAGQASYELPQHCIDFLFAGIADKKFTKDDAKNAAGGKLTETNACSAARRYGWSEKTWSHDDSIRSLRRAAQNGEIRFWYPLGLALENDPTNTSKQKEATFWYRKAAVEGNAAAMLELAINLSEGIGNEKDPVQAVTWYRKAADLGNVRAMRLLSKAIENGEGTAKDSELAFTWLKKAAEGDDVAALRSVCQAYAEGGAVRIDPIEGVRWCRRSAENGNVDSMLNYAASLARGDGVSEDWANAVSWYTKAAAQGSEEARFALFRMGADGYGPKKNRPYGSSQEFNRDAKLLGVSWAARYPKLMKEGCSALEALRATKFREDTFQKLAGVSFSPAQALMIARYTLRQNFHLNDLQAARKIGTSVCNK